MTNQKQRSRCLLEVGKQVEKKYFHVQQPTSTTNQCLKRSSWRLFPPNEPLLFKAWVLLKFHPIQISTRCSLSRTICDKRIWGLDSKASFFLFPWKGFMAVHVLPKIPACTVASKSISSACRHLKIPLSLHVSYCFFFFFYQCIFKYLQCLPCTT